MQGEDEVKQLSDETCVRIPCCWKCLKEMKVLEESCAGVLTEGEKEGRCMERREKSMEGMWLEILKDKLMENRKWWKINMN